MLSMEEAWEALEDAQPTPLYGMRGRKLERVAVKAVMLAVLEEAIHSANCALRMIGEDPIMDGHDLRARIEALGR